MESTNLFFTCVESEKEKYFNHKFKELFTYYNNDDIIDNCYKAKYVKKYFINNVLSFNDISYILIKKYCLSLWEDTNDMFEFHLNIKYAEFERAFDKLRKSSSLRKILFQSYIKNIDIDNASLAFIKCQYTPERKINEYLLELDAFYEGKINEKYNEKERVLKKSF